MIQSTTGAVYYYVVHDGTPRRELLKTNSMQRLITRLTWIVPLLAGAGAYVIAPWGPLVWDDEFVIRQQLVALRSWSDVLVPPAGIPHWSYAFYRPLTVLSYLIDARLFGLGATAGPHTVNVIFHLVATLFVYLLARRLVNGLPRGAVGAVLAATLFAVHPIHTESVSWIMGRSDMLATMLLTPALLLALRFRDLHSPVALVGAGVLFLLALLAKEVAVAGLAILPALWWLAPPPAPLPASTGPPPARQNWNGLAVLAVTWAGAAVLYMSLRPVGLPDSAADSLPAAALLLNLCRAVAWYLLKLVMPWPQTNFVVWEIVPGGLLTAAILAAGAGLLGGALWHWRRRGDGVPLLGLWWIGVALAPSLAAVVPGIAASPLAERYLYLPSAGAAVGLAGLLGGLALSRWARAGQWAAGVLAVAYLVATLQRGYVWLSDLRLWTDTTGRVTGYGLPFIELGRARQASGDLDGALEAYLRARTLKNTPLNTAVANFNIGILYGQRGRLAEAEPPLRAAIAADPGYARGHYGLGRILYARAVRDGAAAGQDQMPTLQQAESELALAIRLNPVFVDAHIALGWVLTTQGDVMAARGERRGAQARYQAALDHLDQATALEPGTTQRPEARDLRRIASGRLSSR